MSATRILALLALLFACSALPSICLAENAAEGSPKQPTGSDSTEAVDALAEDEFLQLVTAYQSGYLQIVAVSCYQLYAGSGLVEGAFRAGHIDGVSALDVLGQNSLLHSVCYTTLVQIQRLTPPDDQVALTEINRLGQLLEVENMLLTALSDYFAQPNEATSKAVDDARTQVEGILESYAAAGEEERR